MDPELCEYIEELLTTSEGVPAPFRAVVQNILDEPIPKNVKRCLLRPLKLRPVLSVHKRKLEKRKAIFDEFDPIVAKNARGGLPQFLLNKEVEKLRRAVVPDNNRLRGDVMLFLNEIILR